MISITKNMDDTCSFCEIIHSESFISELSDRKSATNVTLLSDNTISVKTFIIDNFNKSVGEFSARYSKETFKKLLKTLKKIEKVINKRG